MHPERISAATISRNVLRVICPPAFSRFYATPEVSGGYQPFAGMILRDVLDLDLGSGLSN